MEAEVYKAFSGLMSLEEEDIVSQETDKKGNVWLKVLLYKYATPEQVALAISMTGGFVSRVLCEVVFYTPEELLENEKLGGFCKSFVRRYKAKYKIYQKKEDTEHVFLKQIKKEVLYD